MIIINILYVLRNYDLKMMEEDELLGRVLKAVQDREKERGDEEWLIIVSTDHGRDKKGIHHGSVP